MKKSHRIISALLICVVLFTAGCSSSSSEDNTEPTTILDVHEENISASLFRKTPSGNINVTEEDGRFNLSVSLTLGGKLNEFGNYIFEIGNSFEAEFSEDERGNFSVSMLIDGSNPTVIHFFGDDYTESSSMFSGTIYDDRSGEAVYHKISDLNSLCELFPATSIYVAKRSLPEEDIRIYDEVMGILNDQIDRPEDEILAEIAPDYGMTADELKQFLKDTMALIYGYDSSSSETASSSETISSFQLGEFFFEIYDDLETVCAGDQSYIVTIAEGKSWASFYAYDASEIESASQIEILAEMQHRTWSDPDLEHFAETETPVSFSGFDITFDFYATSDDMGAPIYHLVGTFTDTWYIYTYSLVIKDADTSHSTVFGELIGASVHSGKAPRF